MGGVCSCFHVPEDSTSGNYSCIGSFFRKLKKNHEDQQPAAAGSHNELVLSNGSRPHEPLQVPPEPAAGQQGDIFVALQGGVPVPVRLLVYPNQVQMIKPSAKALSSGSTHDYDYDYDDECPTCLEEYTPENPKILVKCSHHYHLSCIYEWMERSENCPVCGKLMLFEE